MMFGPSYDVVIAGARPAGASTALLLARAGLSVLVVDPSERGRDTLSTHALMRAGVLQLHRWGLLDAIRAEGTPVIDATTFHYGSEPIRVEIAPKDGIDGLYAPRRTVLDRVIVDAAEAAGAEVRFGWALSDLTRDHGGQIVGATLRASDGREHHVSARLVVGADGRNSKVARLVGSAPVSVVSHATASVYGYWPGLDLDGYHWHYGEGLAMGRIPTNGGDTCVFASVTPDRLRAAGRPGLRALFDETISALSPELAQRLAASGATPPIRGFAGAPSVLRRAFGRGWALVGDAGYFKDPLTAHGLSDALRDAELLARAVIEGDTPSRRRSALHAYEATRNRLSLPLLEVTGRIASLTWSMDEIQALHVELSRAMRDEVRHIRDWMKCEASCAVAT